MKYILVVITLVTLSGCSKRVDRFQLERAIKMCGGMENILHIDAYVGMDDLVKCYQFEDVKFIEK